MKLEKNYLMYILVVLYSGRYNDIGQKLGKQRVKFNTYISKVWGGSRAE